MENFFEGVKEEIFKPNADKKLLKDYRDKYQFSKIESRNLTLKNFCRIKGDDSLVFETNVSSTFTQKNTLLDRENYFDFGVYKILTSLYPDNFRKKFTESVSKHKLFDMITAPGCCGVLIISSSNSGITGLTEALYTSLFDIIFTKYSTIQMYDSIYVDDEDEDEDEILEEKFEWFLERGFECKQLPKNPKSDNMLVSLTLTSDDFVNWVKMNKKNK